MKTLIYLVKRNVKLFFKDKGMFISSMITPLILILLYVTFLAKIYEGSILDALPEGITIDDKLINGFVGGWLFSSLLAVCCVTISFCSNLLMIQDKHQNIIKDFNVTPVKNHILSLGYFISTCIVTLIICYIAMIIGFIYLAFVGWYLSFLDVILIILEVLILTLFGTALSSIINFFLKTQGQMSAVGTTVSCTYGFICGAYMPIAQFSTAIQRILMILPGTYGTSMIHNQYLNGVCKEMSYVYGIDMISGIKEAFDLKLKVFGNNVTNSMSFIVITLTTVLLIGIYIMINVKFNKHKLGGYENSK